MIELLTGSAITLIALLIGHSIGKHQTALPPNTQKQIASIFNKVVHNPDVGAVSRPSQEENFYRDNPAAAQEQKIMTDEFKNLNKQ